MPAGSGRRDAVCKFLFVLHATQKRNLTHAAESGYTCVLKFFDFDYRVLLNCHPFGILSLASQILFLAFAFCHDTTKIRKS